MHSALAALGLAVCGVVFGASRARGRLDRAIGDRRERIRLELYTVNQLLAMHVRTGAGPIQATQRIVDRGSGVVVDELAAVLAAVRSGVAEPDGLPPRRRAHARARGRAHLQAVRGRRRARRRSRRRPPRAQRRPPRRAPRGDPQTATKRRAAMLVPTIAVLAPVMLLFIAAPLPSIVFGSR